VGSSVGTSGVVSCSISGEVGVGGSPGSVANTAPDTMPSSITATNSKRHMFLFFTAFAPFFVLFY
jgi:hypothetical protein